MNTKPIITILAIATWLGTSTVWSATPENGDESPGRQDPYGRIYNPDTVKHFTGQVDKVETATPSHGMGRGIHLMVKTDSKTIPVHLGPQWFVDRQEMEFKPGDKIQVTGSQVDLNGESVVIASEVKKGGEVLKLRDENGVPVWAGWRHQGAGPRAAMRGPGRGQGPMQQRMARMSQERQHMMEEHRQMLSKLQSEQADLDKKIEQMNASTGEEKIEAMSAAINQMANERKEMLAHMESMQKRMMAHMDHMRSMMPNPENEPAGAPNQPQEEEENK